MGQTVGAIDASTVTLKSGAKLPADLVAVGARNAAVYYPRVVDAAGPPKRVGVYGFIDLRSGCSD